MTPPDEFEHGSALDLLRSSLDWLWECDFDGRVTRLEPARHGLPAGSAALLLGHRFDDAGWSLARADGGPVSWDALVATAAPWCVVAGAPGGEATQRHELFGVPRPGPALPYPRFRGGARAILPALVPGPLAPGVEQLLAQLPCACWVIDPRTQAFLDVNPAAERIYGYTRREFLDMTEARIAGPVDACGIDPAQQIHLKKNGEQIAVTVHSADIDWRGAAARIVFVSDITERRAASLELKLLYECLEAAGDMIVVTPADPDAAGDHPILYVNRAFEQRTGYSRDEVYGRDARFLQGQASAPEAIANLRRAIAAWETVTVELVNYPRGGEPYWVEMTLTPVADERGWYHYWFSVERDITERKRTELTLAESNLQLERQVAERTRELQHTVLELESFNRMVSHDLQNPLSGVRGFAEMLRLRHGDALPADASRMLGMIQRSADHMHHLIEDLLALSRIGNMQSRPVRTDLAALCLPLVTALRERHPGRELRLEIDARAPLFADLQLLRIVFGQLIDNAWKFTARTPDAVLSLVARATAEGVLVSVRDNGVGFDAGHAQALFRPFQRLHGSSAFEGTGIGLAIVARAVEQMAGWVWADSRPGLGACFHVFLPDEACGAEARPTVPGELTDAR